MTNGSKLKDEMWTLVCTRLNYILEKNTPNELFSQLDPEEALREAATTVAAPTLESSSDLGSAAQVVGNKDNFLGSPKPGHAIPKPVPGATSAPTTSSSEIKINKSVELKRKQPTGTKTVRGKITVQLGLIESLNEIAFTHYSYLQTSHLVILLDTLESVHSFTAKATADSLLRSKLVKNGTY
jgi:hypothetical protein